VSQPPGNQQFLLRAILLLTFLITVPASADEKTTFAEAADLLNQMSLAMSQMTYQGTFVYVQGSLVETMRITHVVVENGIHERLVAQTGPQRELLRDANGVRWIAKDSRAVVLDPGFNRSYFPEVSLAEFEQAAEHYSIAIGGLEPLAGRLGRKLSIVSKDKYRYGYYLWLEDPSGLLLKWELFQNRSRPIARLMFTDVRIGQEVDRSELETSESMEGYSTLDSELPQKQEMTNAKPRWAPSRLPPGFRLTSHRRQSKQAPDLFQHLVYSDGIATVSVYVEPADNGAAPPSGSSQMGTTHAFSRREGQFQITVVGDVPAVTVREIGEAVAQNTP
jgi:sigma-E factor negative regulatory protein RseB